MAKSHRKKQISEAQLRQIQQDPKQIRGPWDFRNLLESGIAESQACVLHEYSRSSIRFLKDWQTQMALERTTENTFDELVEHMKQAVASYSFGYRRLYYYKRWHTNSGEFNVPWRNISEKYKKVLVDTERNRSTTFAIEDAEPEWLIKTREGNPAHQLPPWLTIHTIAIAWLTDKKKILADLALWLDRVVPKRKTKLTGKIKYQGLLNDLTAYQLLRDYKLKDALRLTRRWNGDAPLFSAKTLKAASVRAANQIHRLERTGQIDGVFIPVEFDFGLTLLNIFEPDAYTQHCIETVKGMQETLGSDQKKQ